MKKIVILAMLMLFAGTALMAQDKGVVFQSGTLNELLAKAAKEKKLVFVDVYATWCGPCKLMASKVFPQPQAGAYFNANFINAKFDAENGEGIDVAKKYKVTAYPTFLLLNSSGEEVGRIVGGAGTDEFIKKVKEAVANIDK